MILEDKTVLISGVGPGLGREIAAAALREGANIVIGSRSADRLEQTAAELDATGTRLAFRPGDITNPEDCEALANTATDRFHRLDAVVQVAAFETTASTLDDTPDDVWRKSFETNVVGSAQVVRAAVPHLKASGGG